MDFGPPPRAVYSYSALITSLRVRFYYLQLALFGLCRATRGSGTGRTNRNLYFGAIDIVNSAFLPKEHFLQELFHPFPHMSRHSLDASVNENEGGMEMQCRPRLSVRERKTLQGTASASRDIARSAVFYKSVTRITTVLVSVSFPACKD